eukprot:CAMPEP_0206127380 /NCGR_PEP_ID=MMETSP1472-20131121/27049_1 /ASSEMBLY_ACC=CAM_ASM_001108 /TAXON_ID=41880 /ORGANISM="Pycnococcus provasolii, Strain RCC251" /LENGTH=102 /DNA_ID=CAMNT_0053518477 /DNA_START=159 /DNA_END=463 /DNA_ORIENTATION=+
MGLRLTPALFRALVAPRLGRQRATRTSHLNHAAGEGNLTAKRKNAHAARAVQTTRRATCAAQVLRRVARKVEENHVLAVRQVHATARAVRAHQKQGQILHAA